MEKKRFALVPMVLVGVILAAGWLALILNAAFAG